MEEASKKVDAHRKKLTAKDKNLKIQLQDLKDEIETETEKKEVFDREIKHMKKTNTFINGTELLEIEGLSFFRQPITYVNMLI